MIQFWKYKCIKKCFSSVRWQVLSYIADVTEMIKRCFTNTCNIGEVGFLRKYCFIFFTIFLFYLFSVLLDLVEAPGAFIMGCHAQHKKQVQRVAEAMDEVIHPIMFFCSSTIEQADIETHHFLYVLKFKWYSWVQFEQLCQESIFKTTLKVLPVVGAICIRKLMTLCLQELEVRILILNSRSNLETDSQMNECQVEKSLFSF